MVCDTVTVVLSVALGVVSGNVIGVVVSLPSFIVVIVGCGVLMFASFGSLGTAVEVLVTTVADLFESLTFCAVAPSVVVGIFVVVLVDSMEAVLVVFVSIVVPFTISVELVSTEFVLLFAVVVTLVTAVALEVVAIVVFATVELTVMNDETISQGTFTDSVLFSPIILNIQAISAVVALFDLPLELSAALCLGEENLLAAVWAKLYIANPVRMSPNRLPELCTCCTYIGGGPW